MNLFHTFSGIHALLEERHDFAGLPTAQVLIFVQDNTVKILGENLPLTNHILISTITSCGIDHGSIGVWELL